MHLAVLESPALNSGGKQRPKPVPPQPHSLLADVDAAFGEHILHVPQAKRERDIQHHCRPNDVWGRVEVSERVGRFGARGLGHKPKLSALAHQGEFASTVPVQIMAAHEALVATLGELIEDGNDPRNILCAAVAMIRNMALEIGGTGLLAEAVEVLRDSGSSLHPA